MVNKIHDQITAAISLHGTSPISFNKWVSVINVRLNGSHSVYRNVFVSQDRYMIWFCHVLDTSVRSNPIGIAPAIITKEITRIDLLLRLKLNHG